MKYTHIDGRTVNLHFRSKLADRMGKLWGKERTCVTVDKDNIHIQADTITGYTLAHEYGHTLEAERLGKMYLPTIAWHFIRYGHNKKKNPSERKADEYRDTNWTTFPVMLP